MPPLLGVEAVKSGLNSLFHTHPSRYTKYTRLKNIYMYILPCALAGGILRTGHFARANWWRGSRRRRGAAASLAASCPAIAAQQVPPPGRGRAGGTDRGPSRTPRFCRAALSFPPGLFSAPVPRGRGGGEREGCLRHSLRSSPFCRPRSSPAC